MNHEERTLSILGIDGLTQNERLLLLILSNFADEDLAGKITARLLAAFLRLDVKAARVAMNGLEAKACLSIRDRECTEDVLSYDLLIGWSDMVHAHGKGHATYIMQGEYRA